MSGRRAAMITKLGKAMAEAENMKWTVRAYRRMKRVYRDRGRLSPKSRAAFPAERIETQRRKRMARMKRKTK